MNDQGKMTASSIGKKLLRTLKHIVLHNGWMKLLALIIAVCLWAALISQDTTLTRDKVFTGVSVNVNGADSLKRYGYIVTTDLTELLGNVTVSAAVPQQQFDNADVSAYNLRVDLSKLTSAGTQTVKLLSTASATYGKVTSVSPETITVNVEEYVTRSRIPVSVTVDGSAPEGWYMSAATADPALISVSGPRSVVESISRAKVVLDPSILEWAEGTSRNAVAFTLYDRSGEAVDAALVETTSESVLIDSVIVEQNLYPTRTFLLDPTDLVTGIPAEGYEVMDISISPETVSVAGRQVVLDALTGLSITGTVDVTGAVGQVTEELKVRKPTDAVHISNDTLNVTVELVPVE